MDTNVRALLEPLILQAEREGKWLQSNYQGFWMSPKELREANAKGRFLWGPVNWSLRDPSDMVREAERQVEEAKVRLEVVKAKLRHAGEVH